MSFLFVLFSFWLALLVYSVFSALFNVCRLRRIYVALLVRLYTVSSGLCVETGAISIISVFVL